MKHLTGPWIQDSEGGWSSGPYEVLADGSVLISGRSVGPHTTLEVLERFHRWYHLSGQAAEDREAIEEFKALTNSRTFDEIAAEDFQVDEIIFTPEEDENEEARRYLAWVSPGLDLTPGIVPEVDHLFL